jgi:ATP-binding cassette, subfamily B, bacterial
MPEQYSSHLEFQYHSTHPLKKLLYLYHGQYLKIILSIFLFAIKHSPVWILPIVIARMITIVSDTTRYTVNDVWLVGSIFLVIILQNIPMHTLYVMSLAAH